MLTTLVCQYLCEITTDTDVSLVGMEGTELTTTAYIDLIGEYIAPWYREGVVK